MTAPGQRDLVVLAADGNAQAAIRGLLSRPAALAMRPITYEVFVHPEHDPGCLRRAHTFLRAQRKGFAQALVVFDRHGCGSQEAAADLERSVEQSLSATGWDGCCRIVVIDPELDIWVWSDSPHVDRLLGWGDRDPTLRDWLAQEGLLAADASKPTAPKEALERALRLAHRPRSSALYYELARSVSIARCQDRAFLRLRVFFADRFPPHVETSVGPP